MRNFLLVVALPVIPVSAGALQYDSVAVAHVEQRCVRDSERTQCLFEVLREVTDTQGLGPALSILDALVERNSTYVADAHSVAHMIGIHACGGPETLAPLNVRSEGADGIALCRAITNPAAKRACYEAVGGALVFYAPDADGRQAACDEAEPEFSSACTNAAYLPEPEATGGDP